MPVRKRRQRGYGFQTLHFYWSFSSVIMAVKWLTSTENIRLVRDGKKGVWRWGKREIIITPVATLSPPELRWAVMRAIVMFHNCVGQSQKTVSCLQTTTFQEKGEPKRTRTEVPLLISLTPYRQAKPAHFKKVNSDRI